MATAQALLNIARAELGTKESPPSSNQVKYASWYGLPGQPWCAMFVAWVFDKAGVDLPAHTASCGDLMSAAQAEGCWVTENYRPGDVAIYDFPGGAKTDHCGIIEKVYIDHIEAIEGNTGIGNDSNGGEVMRRSRSASTIVGAVRPEYKKEITMDNTPSPAHKEGVEWCKDKGILLGAENGDLMLSEPVTRQQMCTFLYRFAKTIGQD